MNRLSILAAATVSLLILGIALPARNAAGQETTWDVERLNAASQVFIAAISARDILAMDKVWAHESYVAFMGPLSATIVVGWDGVRKAWEMRFSQFDRVTISLAESHVYTNGKVAWIVGVEKLQLLRRDGKHSQLRCLRDERVREPGWSLAHGFSPSNPNLQGSEIVRVALAGAATIPDFWRSPSTNWNPS